MVAVLSVPSDDVEILDVYSCLFVCKDSIDSRKGRNKLYYKLYHKEVFLNVEGGSVIDKFD